MSARSPSPNVNGHTDGAARLRSANSITLSAAQVVVEVARARATEIGVPMNIAVVDAGGNLVAFARMDGAWLGSIDIAKNKAYTAARSSRNPSWIVRTGW